MIIAILALIVLGGGIVPELYLRRFSPRSQQGRNRVERLKDAIMLLAVLQVVGRFLPPDQVLMFPIQQRWIGIVGQAFGLALCVYGSVFSTWAHVIRRGTWAAKLTNPAELATHFLCVDGPYKIVRHPYYSATIAAVTGLELVAQSWLFVPVFVFMLVGEDSLARSEEEMLLARYGNDYRNYRTRTPWRLIPYIL